MKTATLLFSVFAVAVLAASPVLAGNGGVRLSWDDCAPLVVNKDFTTNTVYTLVMSISNSDTENNGHRTLVKVGNNIQEAWQFWSLGCQDGQLAISNSAVSKACPAFMGSDPLGINLFKDENDGTASLDAANTYDNFAPLAGQRYTLYKASFDHAFSVAGDGNPVLVCRFAGDQLCFAVTKTEMLLVDRSTEPIGIDGGFVSWNDPQNELQCPGAIQVQNQSWGRVKGLYR